MNLLKESLFPSSTSTVTKKSRRTRSNPSKSDVNHGESVEPLLSSPLNNEIELGTIDSDGEDDQQSLKIARREITRSRHNRTISNPAANGGGSIVIVEKPVRPEETIQAFAIRYRVPVSQLKRLNNLQNDQDFYALKFCRVPVRRFGILHEGESLLSATIVNLNDQTCSNSFPITHLTQQNPHAFLNAMDHDLALMRTKVEQLIEKPSATELIPQPTNPQMIIRSSTKIRSDLNCDGADCGCKFGHIVFVIVLIALLVPLVYIYLYLSSPPETTDHHSI